MIVPHRKPCLEGRLNVEGNIEELKHAINDLMYSKKNISILPSGNAGIYVASNILYNIIDTSSSNCNVLVPDMGGWKGFMTYPKMFNFNIVELRTNYGIVDINTLDEEIKKNNIHALFLTSLAGYLAHQPLKEIKKICEENEVIFVEDISGGIGGDCGYGDMVVCSTGSPKIINCEYGGFIGISDKISEQLIEKNKINDLKNLLKTYKVPNIYGLMKEETIKAKKTYKKCVRFSNILKNEFENAYFKDNEGVCVFLEYNNPKEISKNINSVIKLDNGKSVITKCPIYERILKSGIVVEIKKMDVLNISEEDFYEVVSKLKELTL
ncbi:hypothetical protein Mjas_01855 [Methanothermococcus sp. Ax23]|uniref:hypothetical protein n=1 Tax=Methanothermococcus sp. Ax23 TaxID=3156486 RepID=UPI003BA0491C